MSKEVERRELLVFEYGGSARSGKGTIVDHLVNTHPDVAKDETGLYYRILTKQFIDDRLINQNMDTKEVQAALSKKTVGELLEILSEHDKWMTPDKKPELYTDAVHLLSPDVGQFHNAREAVKSGFAARIKALAEGGEYRAVAIDGRNLVEVVKKIDNARMVLRTFVDCSPFEAALRECNRDNVEPDSPAGREILASIEQRNHKDATRLEDPMLIEADAIDYWQGTEVEPAARQLLSAGSAREYLDMIEALGSHFSGSSLPRGIGRVAAGTSRQIKFDTTVFKLFEQSKEAMLAAADGMFEEAMQSIQ